MSSLNIYGLQAKNTSTNIISLASGTQMYEPNTIIQTVTVRSDLRTTYSSPNTGNGTTIAALNTTIIPKRESSLLLITWMINGEMHNNNVFTIHQDNALITTAGFQGFNNEAGNVRWSGVASAFYDRNESTTPSNWIIQYAATAGSTTSRTYAPAVKASTATAYTFAFNRTLNGSIADDNESMISTGMIMEIAQ
jgi:hypothetical protein